MDLSQLELSSGIEQKSSTVDGVTAFEDEAKIVAEVNAKMAEWRKHRQPHEQSWFIAAAMLRGEHYIEWNQQTQRLTVPQPPPGRLRFKVPKIQAKARARLAKFTKNRPRPIVVPATTDYTDYQNAKLSQKALDFQYRKAGLETAYREALAITQTHGRGLWWIYWDDSIMARIAVKDPMTGQTTYQEAQLGDVRIEVGSPFELLVADPAIRTLGDQPEIMRVKYRDIEEMKARYPEKADQIKAAQVDHELFRYEQQIASLSPLGVTASFSKAALKSGNKVLVKEHFVAPNFKHPKGMYRVIAGDTLVRQEDELPFTFFDIEGNPYPCEEFVDLINPGSFWGSSLIFQATDLQKQYNLITSKIAEHIRLMAFPKILVAKQHGIQKSQWTADGGEMVTFTGIPGIPPPQPWTPPPILSDLWRMLNVIDEQMDVVFQIRPVQEGSAAGASSGFMTNLLLEAADTVHALDIRGFEIAFERAAKKIRRLMKLMYNIPRLIATFGANFSPDVFEFSSSNIDEAADIVVEVGSGLPMLKAARQETVMQLYNTGILGDINDPETKRQTRSLLELGSLEESFDQAKVDENQAKYENATLTGGGSLDIPHIWENHQLHYGFHTTWLKSPEGRGANPQLRMAMVDHCVRHAKYVNPQLAMQLAMEEGIQDPQLIQELQMLTQPAIPPGAPAEQGPQQPAPAGPPPQEPAPQGA